jgi:FtsP/CotA-like multicopper oxidase with cupredoxin domain
MDRQTFRRMSRRELLRLGSAGLVLGARALRPAPAAAAMPFAPQDLGCGVGGEFYPTSPLILQPFVDELPIPKALAPTPLATYGGWQTPPGPSSQDCTSQKHQIWPTQVGLPNPIVYDIRLKVAEHSFTSSKVLPIDAFGLLAPSYDAAGNIYAAGVERALPGSTIYGFNGTFPGPMINAEYGKPVLIRLRNELHLNPQNLDRNDFGAPTWGFLTHLHNGHTACESDGNPNYLENTLGQQGYYPEQWCDNLYLMYPAGNDSAEKQSFLWFHDHYMHHTGANVYKGMVGLMPHYDPVLDPGDETNTKGLRLPGVRKNNADGSFDVKYDIPLALYDCALDDGATPHGDMHNGCGESHPEWWGKTFFRHYPNHGFVGDVFTVNGVAYPVLHVKRRKYRLRFLDASIARIYELKLMSSTGGPIASRDTGRIGVGLQGQYQLPDGQQCMRFTQIASEGGLLPFPIVRDSFELWPAKRREFIVDFTKYMDGTPTTKGDVIYLVDTKQMVTGRKWVEPFVEDADGNPTNIPNPEFDPNYRVPLLKIVIEDLGAEKDNSVMPRPNQGLRAMPRLPATFKGLTQRTFVLSRGGPDFENQWVINGLPFDPLKPLAVVPQGSAELWTVVNGGGGWVHPMHMHEEEHRVISRNGIPAPDSRHPEDTGKEDVVALDPGESVTFFRRFRTFRGKYVAHCHNLAHEDHNMMFGWEIV